MLPMDEIKCIRFLRQKKGKSIKEIAKKKKQWRNEAAIHNELEQLGCEGSPRTTRHNPLQDVGSIVSAKQRKRTYDGSCRNRENTSGRGTGA